MLTRRVCKASAELAKRLKKMGRGEASRIAKAMKLADAGLVGRWARGERIPNGDSRTGVENETGIPSAWWMEQRRTIVTREKRSSASERAA